MSGTYWFHRNPKKTLTAFVLSILVLLDLLLGLILIPRDDHSFRRPHYYYHHGWFPNIEAVTTWGSREYPVFSNSLGLADRTARDLPLRSSSRRVLFIGDSFTEGIGMMYDESFVGIIDRAASGYGTEVLNAGVSSYSPKLYYLKTKFLIEEAGLELDELYVFIDLSDVIDELTYESFEKYQSNYLKRFAVRFKKWAYAHSYVHHAIADLLFRRMAERNSHWVGDDHWGRAFRRDEVEEDLAAFRKHPALDARWDAAWTIDDTAFEAWGKRGLALSEANMQKLVDLCKRHGIEVTVGVYPWPMQIFQGDLKSRQVSFWRDFATKNTIGFIDLFPLFIGSSTQADEVYRRYFLDGDVHWNATGHRLVAEAVLKSADFLR